MFFIKLRTFPSIPGLLTVFVMNGYVVFCQVLLCTIEASCDFPGDVLI